MANTELAMTGLRPLNDPAGRVRINYYQANTALALFRFQPVVMNNSGQAATPAIIDASGILGVAIGFLRSAQDGLPPNLTDLGQNAFLDATPGAGNAAIVAVADDPDQYFVCEMDSGGTIVGSANSSGLTVSFTYTATTGNTTTGISNALLDQSTVAADTGGILVLVRPYNEYVNADGTTNDVTLNFSKWVVKIGQHQRGPFGIAQIADRPS